MRLEAANINITLNFFSEARMIRYFLVFFFTLFCVSTAYAIEGDYTITEGKSTAGSSYSGGVVITKTGNTYLVKWMIAKTGEQYSGVGMLENDVLSVGWSSGGVPGVVTYKVEGNKLAGKWAMGSKLSGIENLERKG